MHEYPIGWPAGHPALASDSSTRWNTAAIWLSVMGSSIVGGNPCSARGILPDALRSPDSPMTTLSGSRPMSWMPIAVSQ